MELCIWHVGMFGGLSLRRSGSATPIHPTRRTAALLARLAYPGRRRISRDELTEWLYPDVGADEGRTQLRQVLVRLRRLLEPEGVEPGSVLESDREQVGLNPAAISTDVADFEAALDAASGLEDAEAAAALTRAVSAYTGDLLPSLDGEWVTYERQRLRTRALNALLALAGLCEAAADYASAANHARRAVAIDPFSQGAHLLLIRSAALMGDAAGARRRLSAMARLWREEFGSDAPEAAHAAAAAPSSGSEPPPSPRAHRGRVPVPLTRFYGREAEVDEVCRMLAPGPDRARLLTLTGPGGAGKTRLAVEAAAALMGSYGGALRFVPLAEVAGPGSVASALARVLGVPTSADEALAAAINDTLAGAAGCLILLDNLEHVAADGAMVVETLLSLCPGLAVLATSRRSLGVPGERRMAVAPLEAPPPAAPAECMLEYPSVRMLADRIQARRPGFALTDQNAPAVAALCARLDGLPLAIELVAGWSITYTPDEMLARVGAMPALLSNPSPGAAPRVASLDATMEWSLRLLDDRQRQLFAELSVFRGGWLMDAATEVCGASPSALRSLQECSLVVAGEAGGRMRFGMLETLRDFGGQRLSPAEADRVRGGHARWYAALAERTVAHASDRTVEGWPTTLEPDLANCGAALQWCLMEPGRSTEDIDSGVRMAAALWPYWGVMGQFGEARRWLSAAHEACAGRRTAGHACVLQGLGILLAMEPGSAGALECGEESLAIARELGNAEGEAKALASLGKIHERRGDMASARGSFEQALASARAIGLDDVALSVLLGLAFVAEAEGRPDAVAEAQRQALSLTRKLGNKRYAALLLQELGLLAWRMGDLGVAREYLEESLGHSRDLSDPYREARCLWGLGHVAQARGDAARAAERFRAMLDMVRARGLRVLHAPCLEGLAHTAEARGAHGTAAALLAHAERLREAPDLPPQMPVEMEGNAALALRLRSALGEGPFEEARRRGREMGTEEALRG